MLWAEKFANAQGLDQANGDEFGRWRQTEFFQKLKKSFTKKLADLSQRIFATVKAKVEKAAAATKPVALGRSKAEESWKAELAPDASLMDLQAACKKMNTASLATTFKQLKKDLSCVSHVSYSECL